MLTENEVRALVREEICGALQLVKGELVLASGDASTVRNALLNAIQKLYTAGLEERVHVVGAIDGAQYGIFKIETVKEGENVSVGA